MHNCILPSGQSVYSLSILCTCPLGFVFSSPTTMCTWLAKITKVFWACNMVGLSKNFVLHNKQESLLKSIINNVQVPWVQTCSIQFFLLLFSFCCSPISCSFHSFWLHLYLLIFIMLDSKCPNSSFVWLQFSFFFLHSWVYF